VVDKTGGTLSKVGDEVNYTITLNNTSSGDTPAMICTAVDSLLGIVFGPAVLPLDDTLLNLQRTVLDTDPDPLVNEVTLTCSPEGWENVYTASAECSVHVIPGEGCTPGYWKQEQHFDSWPSAYTPNTLFFDAFDREAYKVNQPDLNLLEALELKGGGWKALARHAAGALINAAAPDVDYPLSVADVIDLYASAVGDESFQDALATLSEFNELFCPLG